MLRLQFVFYVSLCLTAVLSAPTRPQKRSFKIPRIRQANYVPDGPKALRKAFIKFGFGDISFLPEHDAILDANSTAGVSDVGTEAGEVTASPEQNDVEFLSPVSIGGQTLVMNFDTGSSDMWVFNTNLAANLQSGHTIYDPTKSSTFQELDGALFNISYGDGSFSSGPVGTDTVDIGGATVAKQAVGLPNIVASTFALDTSSNGLVGLAFSKLNTIKPQPQLTFFDNIMADLSQPLFTANLQHGVVGGYEFGNIDDTLFQGSLATVPVDSSKGFWAFTSQTAVINGQSVEIPSGSAIADTGTSLMLVDDALVTAYYSQVAGAQLSNTVGGVIFPCDTVLPDLQIAMGESYMATVSGAVMNFSQAGTDRTTGTDFCFGGLQSNQGLGFSIWGDVFFKSNFVVFDGAGPSLMVAPHA